MELHIRSVTQSGGSQRDFGLSRSCRSVVVLHCNMVGICVSSLNIGEINSSEKSVTFC